MLVFPRHARSVAAIARGAASLLTPDIFIQGYTHPSRGTYHHLLCTHGVMLPIFASVSFKAVVIVVIIYYYSGSEKIVSTDGIGALQRACWDSWTRHVTLRILGLMNHAHTLIANAYIFTFEICWVWLILVKFLCNLFSKVCRFIKRPSALLPSCMPCCILCLPSADPFITLFFEVTPKGRGHNCQTPADFLLSGDPWHLALEGAWAGGWESLLFPVFPTSSSSWVVLQGAGEMICMYVHVWCLQRMSVGLTAAKMNDGIIDSFRMQLLTRFLCPALVQRCCG